MRTKLLMIIAILILGAACRSRLDTTQKLDFPIDEMKTRLGEVDEATYILGKENCRT